jgi:DNA-binding response OmpR family regulator
MREFGTREELILLVEDEEPIRDLVTTALCFTGFTVETATNGPEGLALARNNAWHVLVLHVNLPGLDGLSLCPKWLAPARVGCRERAGCPRALGPRRRR